MKIRITSASTPKIGKVLGRVTISMENALGPVFANAYYGAGIVQFTAIAAAAWQDLERNKLTAKSKSRASIITDPFTKEKIKVLCFYLPFDQKELEPMTEQEMRVKFCLALLERLENPGIKIPKEFNYEKFASDMRTEIRNYLSSFA